jgi:predicted dehydrogenase
MASVALIGLGPYSLRTHLPHLFELGARPVVVVDLSNVIEKAKPLFTELNIDAPDFLEIDQSHRNQRTLSKETSRAILMLIKKHRITHAVISTEPQAHFSYLKFFLSRQIHCMVDKPLTAVPFCTLKKMPARQLYFDFKEILRISKKNKARCVINCKRRFSEPYERVRVLVNEICDDWKLPISTLEFSYSDGHFDLPKDLPHLVNHPYRYGYGRLLHGGYHAVDAVVNIVKSAEQASGCFSDNIAVQCSASRVEDLAHRIDSKFIKKSNFHNLLKKASMPWPTRKTEIDFFCHLRFTQKRKLQTLTSLNYTGSGLSARYPQQSLVEGMLNGVRVRQESLNISIGPLMNIKLFDFNGIEKNDRNELTVRCHTKEIHVFRNGGLIPHKKTYERESFLVSHHPRSEEKSALRSFLCDEVTHSDLESHDDSIKLFSQIGETLSARKGNHNRS